MSIPFLVSEILEEVEVLKLSSGYHSHGPSVMQYFFFPSSFRLRWLYIDKHFLKVQIKGCYNCFSYWFILLAFMFNNKSRVDKNIVMVERGVEHHRAFALIASWMSTQNVTALNNAD